MPDIGFGGHKDVCDCCGKQRISYNSCGNRHCPKCQSNKQAIWVDNRISDALDGKYFHVVFTVPEALNPVCLLDIKWFYTTMFECVWSVLQTFGYSHYGVENGAICVLHTWGQNLSLHPHIHCIVPAAGQTLKDNSKKKLTKLSGVEFLRRFCQHILPYRFVKIRYYGILSSKQKQQANPLQTKNQSESKGKESNQQRIVRLTGFDRYQCPFCQTGTMNTVELLPRVRSPTHVLYRTKQLTV